MIDDGSTEFSVTLEWHNTTAVLRPVGDMLGEGGVQLQDLYQGIDVERRDRVIIDCTELRYVNSSGIAGLLSILTQAADEQRGVDFCGVPGHLRRLMDLSGMSHYVQTFDDLEEALESRLK